MNVCCILCAATALSVSAAPVERALSARAQDAAFRKRLEDTRSQIRYVLRKWGELDRFDVEIVGEEVVVQGTVGRRAEGERVLALVRHYPFTNPLIKMPTPAEEAAQDVQAILPMGVRAKPAGDTVFLVGSVSCKKDMDLLEKLQKQKLKVGRFTVNVVNQAALEAPKYKPKVQVAFYFAELEEHTLQNLGVAWSAQIPIRMQASLAWATSGGANPFGRLVGIFTGRTEGSVEALINTLRRRGAIRLYDRYRTVADSGESALYRREGVIYIPVSGVEAVDLKEVPFGAELKVTPEVIRSDLIQTKLEARVSRLAEPINGQITVIEESAKTSLCLTNGEILVVWRAIEHSDILSRRRVPGLGKLPVFGALFRSRDFQKGRTQSAFFIIASIQERPDVFSVVLHQLQQWPDAKAFPHE